MEPRRPLLGWIAAASLLAACKTRPPVPPTAPPDLENAVVQNAAVGGPSTPVGPIQRMVTHKTDESVEMQVNLELGKCYVFSVAGDPATVEEMKLYLFNPAGQRMQTTQGHTKIVSTFCVTGQMVVNVVAGGWGGASFGSATPGLYKVEIKTTEGAGHVLMGVFVNGPAR